MGFNSGFKGLMWMTLRAIGEPLSYHDNEPFEFLTTRNFS